jgi:transposase
LYLCEQTKFSTNRSHLKRSRWLLLRNRENVPAAQLPRLDELLSANASLTPADVMKASLKDLWLTQGGWAWWAAWRNWLAMPEAAASSD